MESLQNELFRHLEAFRVANKLNRTGLAEKLGYSKGYTSKLLDGAFNHSAKKLFELGLKIGKVPVIKFVDVDDYVAQCIEEQQQRTTTTAPLIDNNQIVLSENIRQRAQWIVYNMENTPPQLKELAQKDDGSGLIPSLAA
ncbi:MAG: hypothetical protein JNL05_11655 [Flavobacteriales bacterium]|nr:hypothetical protein [Flavobacteriales bacterium]